ncbi:MAG: hypothetical protein WCF65_03475 [Parachlamydiaceae bacterium]
MTIQHATTFLKTHSDKITPFSPGVTLVSGIVSFVVYQQLDVFLPGYINNLTYQQGSNYWHFYVNPNGPDSGTFWGKYVDPVGSYVSGILTSSTANVIAPHPLQKAPYLAEGITLITFLATGKSLELAGTVLYTTGALLSFVAKGIFNKIKNAFQTKELPVDDAIELPEDVIIMEEIILSIKENGEEVDASEEDKAIVSSVILETVVEDGQLTQNPELKSFEVEGDHSHMVKASTTANNYGSRPCVNTPSSTAISNVLANNKRNLSKPPQGAAHKTVKNKPAKTDMVHYCETCRKKALYQYHSRKF